MSLSNPTAKNPAARFQWRGGAEAVKNSEDEVTYEGGRVTYYDKENQQEVEVDLPFSFIVLDELTTLTGFNDTQQSGYWSNEVRDATSILVARTKQGIQARGTYAKIKEMGLNGLKFAQSVYIAFKDETGELQIGNIKMAGAAMSAWIDFKKNFDISQCAVFITDEPKLAKKGKNYYFIPVFEGQNMTNETKATAVKLDEDLQRYLNTYLSQKPQDDDADATEEDDGPAKDIHNLPGVDKPAPSKTKKTEDVEIENLDETTDEEEVKKPPAPKPATDAKKLKPLRDVGF